MLGSRGSSGNARFICILDRKDGSEMRKIDAGHIDYHAGYATFATDSSIAVYMRGDHDIERIPLGVLALQG